MNSSWRQLVVALVFGLATAAMAGDVTVHLTKNGGNLAGQTLYLFDQAGTYLNSSKITDAAGVATFSVADGSAVKLRYTSNGTYVWSSVVTSPATCEFVVPADTVVTVTKGGAPLANLAVYAFNAAGTYLGISRTTTAAGQALFTLVEGQEVRFRVTDTGIYHWSALTVAPVPAGLNVPSDTTVTVTKGGVALGNVTVYAFTDAGVYTGYSRQTDALGVARFALAAGSSFKFRVSDTGVYHWSALTVAPVPVVLDVPSNTTVTVTKGGVALANLAVYAFAEDGTYLGQAVTTNAAGQAQFALATGLRVRFRVSDSGTYHWSTVDVSPASVGLAVPADSVVTVTKGGVALANVTVYAFSDAGVYLAYARNTDAGGVARFALAEGSSVKFRVTDTGVYHWSDAVQTPAPASVAVPANTVVTVTKAGAAYPNVTVYAFTAAGQYLNYATATDAAGVATFAIAAGMSVKFRVTDQGAYHWSPTVTAPAPATLAVPANTVVTVTKGGAALGNVTVYAFSDAGVYTGYSRQTDALGVARFALAEGSRVAFRVTDTGVYHWSAAVQTPAPASVAVPANTVVTVTKAGAAYPSVTVYAFTAAGQYLNYATATDAAGVAAFAIAAGTSVKFRVTDQGAYHWSPTVTASDPVTLAVPADSVLTVTRNGQPVADLTAYAFTEADVYTGYALTTAADGTAAFAIAAGSRIKFRITDAGQYVWSSVITAPANIAIAMGVPPDTTPPTIAGLTPADGSAVSELCPLIAASITDAESGVDPASIALTIDGYPVSATFGETLLWYVPDIELSAGFHLLSVTASDRAGNVALVTWVFERALLPPSLVWPTEDQLVNVGETAEFGVYATGDEPLSYQWYRNGAPCGDDSDTLTRPNVTKNDDRASFCCAVSNAAGTVTSAAAVLRVNEAPVIQSLTLAGAPATMTTIAITDALAVGATVTDDALPDWGLGLWYEWYLDAGDGWLSANDWLAASTNLYFSEGGNYTIGLYVDDWLAPADPRTADVTVVEFGDIVFSGFSLPVGSTVEAQLSYQRPADRTVVWELAEGGPAGVTIDARSGVVTAAADADPGFVTVIAYDAELTDYQVSAPLAVVRLESLTVMDAATGYDIATPGAQFRTASTDTLETLLMPVRPGHTPTLRLAATVSPAGVVPVDVTWTVTGGTPASGDFGGLRPSVQVGSTGTFLVTATCGNATRQVQVVSPYLSLSVPEFMCLGQTTPYSMNLGVANAPTAGATLSLSAPSCVSLWLDQAKTQPAPTTWNLATQTPPDTLYVQGVTMTPTRQTLTLTYSCAGQSVSKSETFLVLGSGYGSQIDSTDFYLIALDQDGNLTDGPVCKDSQVTFRIADCRPTTGEILLAEGTVQPNPAAILAGVQYRVTFDVASGKAVFKIKGLAVPGSTIVYLAVGLRDGVVNGYYGYAGHAFGPQDRPMTALADGWYQLQIQAADYNRTLGMFLGVVVEKADARGHKANYEAWFGATNMATPNDWAHYDWTWNNRRQMTIDHSAVVKELLVTGGTNVQGDNQAKTVTAATAGENQLTATASVNVNGQTISKIKTLSVVEVTGIQYSTDNNNWTDLPETAPPDGDVVALAGDPLSTHIRANYEPTIFSTGELQGLFHWSLSTPAAGYLTDLAGPSTTFVYDHQAPFRSAQAADVGVSLTTCAAYRPLTFTFSPTMEWQDQNDLPAEVAELIEIETHTQPDTDTRPPPAPTAATSPLAADIAGKGPRLADNQASSPMAPRKLFHVRVAGFKNGDLATVYLERNGAPVSGVTADFVVQNSRLQNRAGSEAWFVGVESNQSKMVEKQPTGCPDPITFVVGVKQGDYLVVKPKTPAPTTNKTPVKAYLLIAEPHPRGDFSVDATGNDCEQSQQPWTATKYYASAPEPQPLVPGNDPYNVKLEVSRTFKLYTDRWLGWSTGDQQQSLLTNGAPGMELINNGVISTSIRVRIAYTLLPDVNGSIRDVPVWFNDTDTDDTGNKMWLSCLPNGPRTGLKVFSISATKLLLPENPGTDGQRPQPRANSFNFSGTPYMIHFIELSFDAMSPYVLIHGKGADHGFWQAHAAGKQTECWPPFVTPLIERKLPFDASISLGTTRIMGLVSQDTINNQATDLEYAINPVASSCGTRHVNLIVHSKGGLDSRYWLTNINNTARGNKLVIGQVITLDTPHRGSAVADLAIISEFHSLEEMYANAYEVAPPNIKPSQLTIAMTMATIAVPMDHDTPATYNLRTNGKTSQRAGSPAYDNMEQFNQANLPKLNDYHNSDGTKPSYWCCKGTADRNGDGLIANGKIYDLVNRNSLGGLLDGVLWTILSDVHQFTTNDELRYAFEFDPATTVGAPLAYDMLKEIQSWSDHGSESFSYTVLGITRTSRVIRTTTHESVGKPPQENDYLVTFDSAIFGPYRDFSPDGGFKEDHGTIAGTPVAAALLRGHGGENIVVPLK